MGRPKGQPATIREGIEVAIRATGIADWRTRLALSLADELDAPTPAKDSDRPPSASIAKELRTLMAAIEADAGPKVQSHADDLKARRARRLAGLADDGARAGGADIGG